MTSSMARGGVRFSDFDTGWRMAKANEASCRILPPRARFAYVGKESPTAKRAMQLAADAGWSVDIDGRTGHLMLDPQ